MSTANKLTTIAENVQKVYEAGKKAEYDAFWDTFQQNGNRKNYQNAFGSCFTPEIFKPKYAIVPKRAYNGDSPENNMFLMTNREGGDNKIDLTNFPIDLSHLYDTYTGNVGTVFNNANIENIFVDLTNIQKVSTLFNYNNSSREPQNIRLRITESLTSITNMFYYMGDVPNKELTISFTEDSVLVTSFGLNQAKYVTPACIRNIFNVASDTVTGQTLTFKTEAITNAFGSVDSAEWQALVSSKPNWTISLI